MKEPLTTAPKHGFRSFHNFPICQDLNSLQADFAILGVPYGFAYTIDEVSNDQTNAPTHIRQFCERALRGLDRWDFDIGGTLLDDQPVRVVDCGDILGDLRDPTVHSRRTEEAVRRILAAGAIPIILGGDHSIPIPVFRAYEGRGPITLVQVDAHIDWRDHINGVREGLSSPIRRASEMDHFTSIFQIGLRAAGSARGEEVRAAMEWGATLIPDVELQEVGMNAVLERIPDGGQYYLTVDADGLDPTIMPAVAGPAPLADPDTHSWSRPQRSCRGHGYRRDHAAQGYQRYLCDYRRQIDRKPHRQSCARRLFSQMTALRDML
jgi:agmatinase